MTITVLRYQSKESLVTSCTYYYTLGTRKLHLTTVLIGLSFLAPTINCIIISECRLFSPDQTKLFRSSSAFASDQLSSSKTLCFKVFLPVMSTGSVMVSFYCRKPFHFLSLGLTLIFTKPNTITPLDILGSSTFLCASKTQVFVSSCQNVCMCISLFPNYF